MEQIINCYYVGIEDIGQKTSIFQHAWYTHKNIGVVLIRFVWVNCQFFFNVNAVIRFHIQFVFYQIVGFMNNLSLYTHLESFNLEHWTIIETFQLLFIYHFSISLGVLKVISSSHFCRILEIGLYLSIFSKFILITWDLKVISISLKRKVFVNLSKSCFFIIYHISILGYSTHFWERSINYLWSKSGILFHANLCCHPLYLALGRL